MCRMYNVRSQLAIHIESSVLPWPRPRKMLSTSVHVSAHFCCSSLYYSSLISVAGHHVISLLPELPSQNCGQAVEIRMF